MTKFGAETTADEVLAGVDLSGKLVFITGGASGLGQETARAMAGKGAHVVIAARNPAKLQTAVTEIKAGSGSDAVESIVCDLASLASVRACADEAAKRFDRIDILINNAGVMACPLGHTEDGFEMQFGTNHLGHFLLTNLLMPLVMAGADKRIVNLSSRAHHIAPVDLDDPNFKNRDYNEWVSYGQAKTANVQFSVGLEQRLADKNIHAYAVHPGGIQTNLGRHLNEEESAALVERVTTSDPDFAWKTIPQGAATQCWAATASELADQGGVYCEDCNIAEIDDASPKNGVRSYALDPASADRLWTLSEQMVGQQFSY